MADDACSALCAILRGSLAEARRVGAVCAASLHAAADAFGGRARDLATRIDGRPQAGFEPTAAFLAADRRLVDVRAADIRAAFAPGSVGRGTSA